MGGTAHARPGRLIAAAVILGVVLSAAGCGAGPSATYKAPDPATMQRDTTGLRAVIPILEELQVGQFEALTGCRGLTGQGQIWSDPVDANCGYSAVWLAPKGGPRPFTSEASASYARIADAIAGSGAAVSRVEGTDSDLSGRLTNAEFVLSEDDWNRWSYFYEPGYTLPVHMRNGPDYIAIDSDWYFRHKSWA